MIRYILYPALLLLIGIVSLIRFKKLTLNFRLLTIYIISTFITESLSLALAYYLHNNSLVQKIYFPVEVTLLSAIYYFLFWSKRRKLIVLVASTFLVLASITLYFIWRQPLLPSYLVTAESLVLIFYAVIYFHQLISHPVEGKLLRLGEFWLNSSILIYSAGSFVFWLTFYYLYHHKIFLPSLQIALFIMNILECLMMGLSIYLNSKNREKLIHENGHR